MSYLGLYSTDGKWEIAEDDEDAIVAVGLLENKLNARVALWLSEEYMRRGGVGRDRKQ